MTQFCIEEAVLERKALRDERALGSVVSEHTEANEGAGDALAEAQEKAREFARKGPQV